MKLTGKKWIVCAGMTLGVWLGAEAQTQDQTSNGCLDLTLQKAIEIALADNPTIKVADKEVELKRVADKEAWQKLLPTADLNAGLSHSIKVAEMRTSMGTFKMGMDGSTTAQAGVTVALPLYAPAAYQNMKLTKEDIQLAQEQARGSRLDLVKQVTKAYYGALLSADTYEVMCNSYKTAKNNFEVVDNKYKVGRVSEYDKISAEVQMRNTNSSMVSAQTGKNLALLKLKVLMGITENIDINIKDSLKAYEGSLRLSEADYNDSELDNNTDLRQIDQNAEKLKRTRKLLNTNFLPTLGMSFTGQYQSMSNSDWNLFSYKYSPSLTVAFNLSVPLFHADNFTKLKSNRLLQEQLSERRQNTRNQLAIQSESYRQNMASTMAQIESNREAVKQAGKAVSISEKRYEVGKGTILELNQTQDAFTLSELTYVQSIYDFLSNKADLDYTLGRNY